MKLLAVIPGSYGSVWVPQGGVWRGGSACRGCWSVLPLSWVYNLSIVVCLVLFPQEGLSSSLSVLTPYLLSRMSVQDCLDRQIRSVFLSLSFSRVAPLLQHLLVWALGAVGDKCREALLANLTPRWTWPFHSSCLLLWVPKVGRHTINCTHFLKKRAGEQVKLKLEGPSITPRTHFFTLSISIFLLLWNIQQCQELRSQQRLRVGRREKDGRKCTNRFLIWEISNCFCCC